MNDLPYSRFIMPFMYEYNLVGVDVTQLYGTTSLADFMARQTGYVAPQTSILLDISKGLVIAVLFSLFGGLFSKERRSITHAFLKALINFSIILVIAVCVSAIFNRISFLGDVANYVLLSLSGSGVVATMIMIVRKKCSKLELEFKLSASIGSVLIDGFLKPFIRTAFMIFAIAFFINAYLGSYFSFQLEYQMYQMVMQNDIQGMMSLNCTQGSLPMMFVIGIIILMVLMDLLDNKLRTKFQVSLSAKLPLKAPFPQGSFPQPYPLQQYPPQIPVQQSSQPTTPSPPPQAFCKQCGKRLSGNAQFCGGCGIKVN